MSARKKKAPPVMNVDSAGPPRWVDYCDLGFSQDAFSLRMAMAREGDKAVNAHTVIVMSPESGKQLRALLGNAIAAHEKIYGATA